MISAYSVGTDRHASYDLLYDIITFYASPQHNTKLCIYAIMIFIRFEVFHDPFCICSVLSCCVPFHSVQHKP